MAQYNIARTQDAAIVPLLLHSNGVNVYLTTRNSMAAHLLVCFAQMNKVQRFLPQILKYVMVLFLFSADFLSHSLFLKYVAIINC